jgi:hypothetical protein
MSWRTVFSQPYFERVCEDEIHTPKVGTWESFETPETSKFDRRGQNTLPWSVFYIIGNLLKCKCPKWARMGHLDICSTSYSKKNGRESNWQFDSRPLKVGNQLELVACRQSATHHWKALEESYKFSLDLIPIRGWSKKLWPHNVPRVQTGTVSGLLLGNPGTKSHSDVGVAEKHKVYYMGEGGGFPRVRAVVSQVSPELPMACTSTKGVPKNELTNLMVGLMQVRVNKWSFSLFLVPSRSFNTPLLPFLVLRTKSVPEVLHNLTVWIS